MRYDENSFQRTRPHTDIKQIVHQTVSVGTRWTGLFHVDWHKTTTDGSEGPHIISRETDALMHWCWDELNAHQTAEACTVMLDEHIQSHGISLQLTKPNHSNLALLAPWCWTFSGTCVTSLANSQSQVLVKGWYELKKRYDMINLNAFTVKKVLVRERGRMLLLYQRSHKWNVLS